MGVGVAVTIVSLGALGAGAIAGNAAARSKWPAQPVLTLGSIAAGSLLSTYGVMELAKSELMSIGSFAQLGRGGVTQAVVGSIAMCLGIGLLGGAAFGVVVPPEDAKLLAFR